LPNEGSRCHDAACVAGAVTSSDSAIAATVNAVRLLGGCRRTQLAMSPTTRAEPRLKISSPSVLP
jgi:hypothetical protein